MSVWLPGIAQMHGHEDVLSKTFRFLFGPFCEMQVSKILLLVVPWSPSLRKKYSWRCMNESLDPCPTPL